MGVELKKQCDVCCNQTDPEEEIFNADTKDCKNNFRSLPIKAFNKGSFMSSPTGDYSSYHASINKGLLFPDNSPSTIVTTLTSPLIYEKMIGNERLHQILEPLTSLTNKVLFEIMSLLLLNVRNLYFGATPYYNDVYNYFTDCLSELENKKIIDDLNRSDLGFYTKVKYHLLYVIELLVELYQYFRYQRSNGKEPYNEFFWDNIKDHSAYMKAKIIDIQKVIEDISNFMVENKLKGTSECVDIHITTNKFNVSIAQ